MSYVKIMIHAVWGTKCRYPFLNQELRHRVIDHIQSNAEKKKIRIDTINGYLDHLHCLLELNANMTVATAMQLMKGESSFWINKSKLTDDYFEWADEYYAVSIGESEITRVRAYIQDQEHHHAKSNYDKELHKLAEEEINKRFGITPD